MWCSASAANATSISSPLIKRSKTHASKNASFTPTRAQRSINKAYLEQKLGHVTWELQRHTTCLQPLVHKLPAALSQWGSICKKPTQHVLLLSASLINRFDKLATKNEICWTMSLSLYFWSSIKVFWKTLFLWSEGVKKTGVCKLETNRYGMYATFWFLNPGNYFRGFVAHRLIYNMLLIKLWCALQPSHFVTQASVISQLKLLDRQTGSHTDTQPVQTWYSLKRILQSIYKWRCGKAPTITLFLSKNWTVKWGKRLCWIWWNVKYTCNGRVQMRSRSDELVQ